MPGGDIHGLQIVFLLLLLFVVAFGALARKLSTPYPIILVIAGLLLSFIPGVPRITLDPDVVFFVIFPPLLYSAAWLTSWREFSYNMVSILLLAFGLVLFTVFGVAAAARWLPGFDWRSGFILGAIVAPTDAIAASSIARRIGLPKRIVDLLEGESLVNDASALLALEFGIAMLVNGRTPSVGSGLLRLSYLILVGLAVGLIIGWVVHVVEHLIDDAPIEIVLSILTPYAAYLAAESVHASGVLAVVSCGLYLSRRSSHFFSPGVRLRVSAFWESLTFILNGLVFVLIGLQLPYVHAGIQDIRWPRLLYFGGLFSALLIVLRLVWVFPGAYVANLIRSRLLHQPDKPPMLRQVFVVGWTGMRGVISLAAAIALPATLANGAPFTQHNMIVFLAFSVILVTLVLQGLTLPPLIRTLGLAGTPRHDTEEKEARRAVLQAALDYLANSQQKDRVGFSAIYDDLAHHYNSRLDALADEDNVSANRARMRHHGRYLELSRELLGVERRAAVLLRNEGRISDELLRQLEYELDLGESKLAPAD